jgi:hypothetical protein
MLRLRLIESHYFLYSDLQFSAILCTLKLLFQGNLLNASLQKCLSKLIPHIDLFVFNKRMY